MIQQGQTQPVNVAHLTVVRTLGEGNFFEIIIFLMYLSFLNVIY